MAIKATYIMVMNGNKFVREIPRLIDFSGSLAGEHELQFQAIIYGRACVRKVRGICGSSWQWGEKLESISASIQMRHSRLVVFAKVLGWVTILDILF